MIDEFGFDIDEFFRTPFACFKGGGGGYSAPPSPSLSNIGKWTQQKLYADYERAIRGGGLIPSGMRGFGKRRTALKKAYGEARPELEGQLSRLVPHGDVKVKGFARNLLDRSLLSDLEGLRREEITAPYEEQQEGLELGISSLAGEKRMSASITDMYNQQQAQAMLNQMQYGSFGTNLAAGLGGAGGWAAGWQRYAQQMAQPQQGATPATSSTFPLDLMY